LRRQWGETVFNMKIEGKLVTMPELARRLKVGEDTVNEIIKLRKIRIGSQNYVTVAEANRQVLKREQKKLLAYKRKVKRIRINAGYKAAATARRNKGLPRAKTPLPWTKKKPL